MRAFNVRIPRFTDVLYDQISYDARKKNIPTHALKYALVRSAVKKAVESLPGTNTVLEPCVVFDVPNLTVGRANTFWLAWLMTMVFCPSVALR